VGGLLPIVTRFMDHSADKPTDMGMEFDERALHVRRSRWKPQRRVLTGIGCRQELEVFLSNPNGKKTLPAETAEVQDAENSPWLPLIIIVLAQLQMAISVNALPVSLGPITRCSSRRSSC
jgi:hypothetical protein